MHESMSKAVDLVEAQHTRTSATLLLSAPAHAGIPTRPRQRLTDTTHAFTNCLATDGAQAMLTKTSATVHVQGRPGGPQGPGVCARRVARIPLREKHFSRKPPGVAAAQEF